MIVASSDVDEALATSTVIDSDEFDKVRLDQRWREFCLNAEQYVAETTRPRPQVRQTASSTNSRMTALQLLAVLRAQLYLAHAERVERKDLVVFDQNVGRDMAASLQCRPLEPLGRRLASWGRRSLEPIDGSRERLVGLELFAGQVHPFPLRHGGGD